MTLQASASSGDPLSLREIMGEFGDDGTASLRDFNRGGSYVPNITLNNNISTSPGSLTILQFLGGTVAGWQDDFVGLAGTSGINPGAAGCSFTIQADGTYDATISGAGGGFGAFTDHRWRGAGSSTVYYTYSTVVAGTHTPTGTFDAWVSTASDRTHSLFTTSGNDKSATIDIKLSTTASDTGLIDTIQVEMSAEGAGSA
jgi:hypothetical protein